MTISQQVKQCFDIDNSAASPEAAVPSLGIPSLSLGTEKTRESIKAVYLTF